MLNPFARDDTPSNQSLSNDSLIAVATEIESPILPAIESPILPAIAPSRVSDYLGEITDSPVKKLFLRMVIAVIVESILALLCNLCIGSLWYIPIKFTHDWYSDIHVRPWLAAGLLSAGLFLGIASIAAIAASACLSCLLSQTCWILFWIVSGAAFATIQIIFIVICDHNAADININNFFGFLFVTGGIASVALVFIILIIGAAQYFERDYEMV